MSIRNSHLTAGELSRDVTLCWGLRHFVFIGLRDLARFLSSCL